METMTRNVDDLSVSDRDFLERFLGRRLEHGQQVVVTALNPGENEPSAARVRLQLALDRAARHASDHGITPEEADAAVAEAMEMIRHRPKS
jgi:hypothetical protein